MKRIELPGGEVVEYRHDPLGRRVAKLVDGDVTEKYLWMGRTTLLAVYNGDGALKSRFLYADGRMPMGMVQDGETYYFAYDQVGSLRAVTDATGSVVKTMRYDSFGNIIEDTNPELTVPFGFAGGLHDRDTGLVRFGYRDYDPDTGRWTAKDPIGFKGQDSNLYSYVFNNPIGWLDATGLKLTKAQCRRMYDDIKRQQSDLERYIRDYDPVEDAKGNHFSRRKGGYTKSGGHYQQIKNRQRGLKNRIEKYKKQCLDDDCDGNPPLPAEVIKLADKYITPPPGVSDEYERTMKPEPDCKCPNWSLF